jgi:sec-independent protein translocase protein TatB
VNAPGFWEIVFLAVLALLIFGPDRLPKIAQSAGEMIAKFKREAAGTLDELKAAADLDEFTGVARDLRETTTDLRRSMDLTGPLANDSGPDKPRTATMPTAQADVPPPFDPDTP